MWPIDSLWSKGPPNRTYAYMPTHMHPLKYIHTVRHTHTHTHTHTLTCTHRYVLLFPPHTSYTHTGSKLGQLFASVTLVGWGAEWSVSMVTILQSICCMLWWKVCTHSVNRMLIAVIPPSIILLKYKQIHWRVKPDGRETQVGHCQGQTLWVSCKCCWVSCLTE